MVTQRKGELVNMERHGDRIHQDFKIPSRGIIGLRTNLMTATAGGNVDLLQVVVVVKRIFADGFQALRQDDLAQLKVGLR